MAITMTMGADAFSTDPVVGGCDASNRLVGSQLPWVASQLVVINDSGVNLHVSVNSTAASTSDWYLLNGESQTWSFPINRFGLTTTSTSTTAKARAGAWRY